MSDGMRQEKWNAAIVRAEKQGKRSLANALRDDGPVEKVDYDVLAQPPQDAHPLPKIASPGLIESMALRYHHGFGLLDKDRQEAIRGTMRQLYEEVAGYGFYEYPTARSTPSPDQNIKPERLERFSASYLQYLIKHGLVMMEMGQPIKFHGLEPPHECACHPWTGGAQ